MGAACFRATRRGRRPRRPAKPSANGHPPDSHPRRGQRPLPTGRTIDGCSRQPPGRACPAPTARRPGDGCPRKPHSVSISPSVGRGAPTPPRPSAAANNNPCLPPWGKVAPQGRMRGRLPLPPIPGQAVGGGVPDAPRNLPPTAIPRTATRGGVKDPSLRAEPLTGAHANPRAGHARPLPRGGPGTAARVNPTAFPYPHP